MPSRKYLRARTWLPTVLLCAGAILGSLLFAELSVRYFVYGKAEREKGAEALWRSFSNSYVQSIGGDTRGCTFADSLIPHPYLGFVHHRIQPCGFVDTNNRGLLAKYDFPRERDPNFFTVLLLGGSVANQLAAGRRPPASGIWLEEELGKYRSPNGKPFRVLSGAAGGWRLPNQTTMVAAYGDAVDAVVVVDGYNEAMNAFANRPVDYPDQLNYINTARPRGFGFTLTGIAFLNEFRRLAGFLSPLRHSLFAFFVFERGMSIVAAPERFAPKEKEIYGRIFDFPEDWSPEKRAIWNKEKYKNYVRLLRGQADALKIPYAHFLQPIRWVGKELTEEEKSYAEFIDVEQYRRIFADSAAELAREGLPFYSLLHVFEGVRETIYADFIHCKVDAKGESPGYARMSARIAENVAAAWRLKKL